MNGSGTISGKSPKKIAITSSSAMMLANSRMVNVAGRAK